MFGLIKTLFSLPFLSIFAAVASFLLSSSSEHGYDFEKSDEIYTLLSTCARHIIAIEPCDDFVLSNTTSALVFSDLPSTLRGAEFSWRRVELSEDFRSGPICERNFSFFRGLELSLESENMFHVQFYSNDCSLPLELSLILESA